jgi:hypothetical protein
MAAVLVTRFSSSSETFKFSFSHLKYTSHRTAGGESNLIHNLPAGCRCNLQKYLNFSYAQSKCHTLIGCFIKVKPFVGLTIRLTL